MLCKVMGMAEISTASFALEAIKAERKHDMREISVIVVLFEDRLKASREIDIQLVLAPTITSFCGAA